MRALLFLLASTNLLVAETHWAFVPPVDAAVPAAPEWARSPVDAFLREASDLADQGRLMRRLSLDLRGLPVSLMEQEAFLKDDHPEALSRLTDRFLASPLYGERMAQDWLDLARYADTTGHAADQPRTMWLYRDWVIDALNTDMPYDQFTVEQLAGDRLANATESQRIATGFHRNSMQALGNNPRKEEFRVRGVVDRMDVTGQVWLGLSLACAECHDHTHDPISQKEYFQLYAIFNQTPHYGEKFKVRGPRLTVKRDGKEVEAQIMNTLETPRPTYIHVRGNFEARGEQVSAKLPALFGGSEVDRLGFARWLVSAEQPLTARVAVNRAWECFFGVGLVKTANDFGVNGEHPTHPKLLDWLALRFSREGWSMKRLHRDLVTSAAYLQSSVRFRMSAEALRDQALAVSGLLVDVQGGPSVFPQQPEGVGEFRDATAGEWTVSEDGDQYRRSLYTFWQRMAPHPAMTTFDAPSREWCTVTRSRTNTPMQALAMLNDPAMVEAQTAFAEHLDELPESSRLTHAFCLALARQPSAVEREQWELVPVSELSQTLATVLFNLDEFLTRE